LEFWAQHLKKDSAEGGNVLQKSSEKKGSREY
jgi:hypothetical protein